LTGPDRIGANAGERNALVEARCAEAEALLLQDRFDEARAAINHALRLAPRHAAAVHILGIIEMESGSLERAVELIKRAAALDPKAHEPLYYLASTYGHLGRWEEAVAAYRAALARKPDVVPVLQELATALLALGRQEEAIATLRRVAALDPDRLRTYTELAQADPASLTEADLGRLQAVCADPAQDKERTVSAAFALASLFEHRGEYDAAFAHLRRGNDLYRELLVEGKGRLPPGMVMPASALPRRLDPAAALAEVAQSASSAALTFTQEFLGRYRGFGHPSSLPIFVVGMPRSGSTLIEQILSSHPLVHGAGEVDTLSAHLVRMQWPHVGYRLPGPDGVTRPTEPPKPPARYFRERGAAYVKALRAFNPRAQRVVDKMLGNYQHVGMIELCLPKAVIIHAVRDPVDNCLGCYKRLFATGNETTYDLGDIGRHYVHYRRTMEHWARVLPGRVVDVVYEEMVAEPADQIRRLLEACGLPWNDACMRFYETQRPVRTASLVQVRRPIYQTSVQRWRRYEKHLGPLFEALGPYAPKDVATGARAPNGNQK
jgi:tetratricopeptide (TPR) repeat protein